MKVITIGKRTIEYNPIVEIIKEKYSDDIILLDTLFTWDIEKAIIEQKRIQSITEKQVVIDGVGWRNGGHDGFVDLNSIDAREYVPDNRKTQITKITEGCPNSCEFCFSGVFKVIGIPKILRNHVQLTDENILAHPDIENLLKELSNITVNNRVVYYEAICGFEKKRITPKIAELLKQARFKKIRFAWDERITDHTQKLAKQTVKTLVKAGYNPKDISIFVLTNWNVSIEDCLKKLDLMKIWNVKVNDCCFNCNYDNPIPHGWTMEQIIYYRAKARKHNQMVNFEIDPEQKRKDGGRP